MTDKNHAPHSEGGDYEVGYRRPPKATRFQPGASGNPRGRPKGRKNFNTELLDELGRKIAVVEKGKRRLVRVQTIIIKCLVKNAAEGDARAREQLVRLIRQVDLVPGGFATGDIEEEKEAEIPAQTRAHLVTKNKEND